MTDKIKTVNIFWYKMPNGQNNFGDILGPYIVERLSGLKTRYIPIVNTFPKTLIIYLVGLFKGSYSIHDIVSVFYSLNKSGVLLTIGSVLSCHNNKTSLIWGTGLMNMNDKINNANFYAVRGKYSQQRLRELGYNVPHVIGDPALLLPLLVKPSQKKYQLGIIPHYIHYNEIKKRLKTKDILIINLLEDIEVVIEKITSCDTTISSSLHGLIVSHAYQIPSLWFELSKKQLGGDNVKFKDYFSSVNIEEYSPFNIDYSNFKKENVISTLANNSHINSIQADIQTIQKKLINSAPFPILEKYKL